MWRALQYSPLGALRDVTGANDERVIPRATSNDGAVHTASSRTRTDKKKKKRNEHAERQRERGGAEVEKTREAEAEREIDT